MNALAVFKTDDVPDSLKISVNERTSFNYISSALRKTA